MRRFERTNEFPNTIKNCGCKRAGKYQNTEPTEQISPPKDAGLSPKCKITPKEPRNCDEQRWYQNVINERATPQRKAEETFRGVCVFENHIPRRSCDETYCERLNCASGKRRAVKARERQAKTNQKPIQQDQRII